MNKKLINICYWLIICLLAFLIHWSHPINSDEGIILTGAWRIMQGQIPYLDFFDFITPGSFYFLAIIFKLFGANYLVAKLISILLLIISGVGIYLISDFYFKKNFYKYLTPIIWLMFSAFYPLINHNQYSIYILIWSFYFFIKSFNLNSAKYYFITGVLSGLTFWFLQVKGAVIIFTIIFLFLLYNRKNIKKLFYYFLGLIITLIPLLYWSPDVLWFIFIKFPFENYISVNTINPSILIIGLILYFINLFFGIIKTEQKEIYFLWWLGLFLILSTGQRSDLPHIMINSWPLIIIIFFNLAKPEIQKIKKIILMIINWICLIIIFPFFLIYSLPDNILLQNNIKFWDKIRLKNKWLSEVDTYVKNITTDNDYIYAGPFIPNFYFELNRKNPTRFNILITEHHPKNFFLEAAADLKNKKPKIIILEYNIVKKFNYNKNNVVDEFIWKNYQLDKDFFGVQILKLK
ncbi:MAG: glycosyltransferase family 39 protein [Patescibacteria group bacterium]